MKNCIFPDCKSRLCRLFFFVQVFLHCNCFCKFCILNVYRLTQWRTGNPRPTKSRPRVKGSGFNFARGSESQLEVRSRARSASYQRAELFPLFFLRQKKEVPAQRPGHSRAEVFWKRFLVFFSQSLLRCMPREHSCCFHVLISGIFQENSLQKIQAERT